MKASFGVICLHSSAGEVRGGETCNQRRAESHCCSSPSPCPSALSSPCIAWRTGQSCCQSEELERELSRFVSCDEHSALFSTQLHSWAQVGAKLAPKIFVGIVSRWEKSHLSYTLVWVLLSPNAVYRTMIILYPQETL